MAQLPDRPGPQLIVKMINDANNTTFTVNDFTFGTPEPSVRPNFDTQIDLTFVTAPYIGTIKRFYYNRLDLTLLIGLSNTSFEDSGLFVNTSGVLDAINARRSLHLSLNDVVDDTFDIVGYPANLQLTARNDSLVLLPGGAVDIEVTEPVVTEEFLRLDFTYVDQEGPAFLSFIAYVNDAVDNGPSPDFSALDAAYAYRITEEEQYRTLAIDLVEAEVLAAEAQIDSDLIPTIADDDYSGAGLRIAALSTVLAWCAPSSGQVTRWSTYANRTIDNIRFPDDAVWGAIAAPWTGTGVSDPGNSLYYSYTIAAATWALATNNETLLTFVSDQQITPLNTYLTEILGGGTREGTGFAVELMNLLDLYTFWRDSGQADIANANDHMWSSIYYWVHATMPTFDRYCPIGDLPREAYPWLQPYHRSMMLKFRQLTNISIAQDMASWWLGNITVQPMDLTWQLKYNLIPAGEFTTPPDHFSYRAAGAGCLFARTSWDTDAVHFHYLAGTYDQPHAHQAQGSFTLFRNDYLAVTPNIYSTSGVKRDVIGQNVLRFNLADTSVIPQTFGEATMSSTINGVNGDVNAQSILTAVMDDPTVENWKRDVFFLDGVLNVKDTFATNSGTTATFQVCVNAPSLPSISNGVIVAGDLEIIVFDPYSPTLDMVEMEFVDADYESGYRVDISGGDGIYDVELRSVAHSGSAIGDGGRARFSDHPVTDSVPYGGSATFEATAVQPPGSSTLSMLDYAWEMKTGGAWDETGDYTSSMTINGLTAGAAGWKFRCKVTNENGVTYSREAGLIIAPNTPVITTQPTDQSGVEGSLVQFEVIAEGYGVLSYEWQILEGEVWVTAPNPYASVLEFETVSLSQNGAIYRVLVSTDTVTIASEEVALTVTPL
jgi:hypothetical protein